MAGLFSHPELRMEQIQFHNDHPIGSLLEVEIKRIYEKVKDGWYDFEIEKSDEVKNIKKLLFEHFGLKFHIVTTTPHVAAVIPFHLNENAVLMDDQLKDTGFLKEQEALRSKSNTGWVDEQKVKVGGVFSEYENTLFLNFNSLRTMLQGGVSRTVGVLLHEVGHAFYACAYTNRMDETNQIISAALRKGAEAKIDRVEVVYKEFKDKGVEINKQVLQGLTSKDPMVLGRTAFQIANETVYSQMASSKYSETSFEQLADNFAVRLGYGKDLVSSLELLSPGGVRFNYFYVMLMTARNAWVVSTTLFNCIMFFLKLSNTDAVTIVLNFFRIFQVLRAMIFCAVFLVYMVQTSGEGGRDYTYDDLVKRYNRIRNQLIEMIKKKELPKAQAQNAIKSIESIGKMIKGVSAYRGPLDFFFNTFNPKDRRAKSSIERQQAIEDLMSNPLFVVALKAKFSAA